MIAEEDMTCARCQEPILKGEEYFIRMKAVSSIPFQSNFHNYRCIKNKE